MRIRWISLCGLTLALLTGCGDDTTPTVSGTGDSGEASGSTGADTGAASTPALGISIVEIAANQGTRVPIGVGGEWNQFRETSLLQRRDTLVRVFFEVDESWVPREIEGRLTVTHENGETGQWAQRQFVEGNSEDRYLDSTFYFGLVADNGDTEPGSNYRFELWETGSEGEGLPIGINANPAEGEAPIGFEAVSMEMNVMFVPIDYAFNGEVADVSEAKRKVLEDRVFQMNPLQSLNATYHDPYPYADVITNMGVLLGVMSQLRNAEGAPDNQYYAALLPVGGVNGVGGIASLGGLVSANGWESPNTSADVVTHELGHNQGLSHVACPGGNAAGPDPSYPYEQGQIGNRGFGVRDFIVHRVSDFDIMTYCGQQWVSDWTWRKVWPRIQGFTAMGDAVGPKVPTLQGIVHPDGTSDWWEGPAPFSSRETISGNFELEWWRGSERVAAAHPRISMLSDDQSLWSSVPMGDVELPSAAKPAADTGDGLRVTWRRVGVGLDRAGEGEPGRHELRFLAPVR